MYGLGLATTTIRLINGTLHNALKKAISLGMIEINPCNGVEFRKSITSKEKELHYFNKDQIETFLEYAKEENEYIYYYFFLTTIYTGMRKGELMALQWSNVDFLRNTIKIDQTRLYRKEKRGQLELSTPKTESGFRTLVTSKTVKQALLELKNRQQNYLPFYSERKYPNTDFVFCFKNFNPIADRTVNGAFERISKKAKLSKIKVHDLRHTHAVLLRQAGVSLEDIQGIPGHKNPTATLIYTHITEEVNQSAMDKLDNHMETKTKSNATKAILAHALVAFFLLLQTRYKRCSISDHSILSLNLQSPVFQVKRTYFSCMLQRPLGQMDSHHSSNQKYRPQSQRNT